MNIFEGISATSLIQPIIDNGFGPHMLIRYVLIGGVSLGLLAGLKKKFIG